MFKKTTNNFLLVTVVALLSFKVHSDDIYMIARAKATNSTLTSVVFFKSKEISSIRECEKEREYGSFNNWRVFTHIVNTNYLSFGTQYRCAKSSQKISRWISDGRHSKKYLVRYDKNKNLSVTPVNSISQCRKSLLQEQSEENINLFCAHSSQNLSSL